jgi:hypothetical protein
VITFPVRGQPPLAAFRGSVPHAKTQRGKEEQKPEHEQEYEQEQEGSTGRRPVTAPRKHGVFRGSRSQSPTLPHRRTPTSPPFWLLLLLMLVLVLLLLLVLLLRSSWRLCVLA